MNIGKWLLKTHSFIEGYKMHIYETAVCSNCGKELKGKEYIYHFDQPPIKSKLLSKELKAIKPHLEKYCPHCGVKMKRKWFNASEG